MPFFVMLIFVVSSILISPTAKTQGLAGYTFDTINKSTPFKLELNPFSTDGCSRYPDGTKENPTLWRECCVNHDMKYWLGGTSAERKEADKELYQCVKNKGETFDAEAIYLGVRTGGGPLRPTTYRWGYGWNRIRNYKILSKQEKEMAYQMYGDNLEELKKNIKENKYIVLVPDSYAFSSPFPYTYCEEQVINYLLSKLSHNATVTKSLTFSAGTDYTIRLNLDICNDAIEFEFNQKTNSQTCKRDYGYSNIINQIENVRMTKDCQKKL